MNLLWVSSSQVSIPTGPPAALLWRSYDLRSSCLYSHSPYPSSSSIAVPCLPRYTVLSSTAPHSWFFLWSYSPLVNLCFILFCSFSKHQWVKVFRKYFFSFLYPFPPPFLNLHSLLLSVPSLSWWLPSMSIVLSSHLNSRLFNLQCLLYTHSDVWFVSQIEHVLSRTLDFSCKHLVLFSLPRVSKRDHHLPKSMSLKARVSSVGFCVSAELIGLRYSQLPAPHTVLLAMKP